MRKYKAWTGSTMLVESSSVADWNLFIRSFKKCQEQFLILESLNKLDKNKKELFQGDIVVNGKLKGVVAWNPEICGYVFVTPTSMKHMTFLKNFEIIGNIHENPELIDE